MTRSYVLGSSYIEWMGYGRPTIIPIMTLYIHPLLMGWLSWPYPFLIVWESTPWFDNNAYLPCIHKKNRKGWRNWRPPSSPRWSPRRVWSIKYTGYNYLDFTHTHHKITGFSQTLNSGYVDVSPPVRDCFEQVTRKFPSASSNLGTKRLSATGAAGGCAGAKGWNRSSKDMAAAWAKKAGLGVKTSESAESASGTAH